MKYSQNNNGNCLVNILDTKTNNVISKEMLTTSTNVGNKLAAKIPKVKTDIDQTSSCNSIYFSETTCLDS